MKKACNLPGFLTAIAIMVVAHGVAIAQDERQLRSTLGKDYQQQELVNLGKGRFEQSQVKWTSKTPLYRVDLNDDGKEESLLIERKDARVYALLFDNYNRPLAQYEFKVQGAYAEVPKVHVRQMAPGLKVLIFHFYRGKTDYTEFYAAGKLYFATIKSNNSNVPLVDFSEGPAYFEEQFDGQKHYHKKPYVWELHDYNNDGIQEIVVMYNKINRIYMYDNNKLRAL